MVIFERMLAGIVRYRKVFLASGRQLDEIVDNLGPFEVVRVFWSLATGSSHRCLLFEDKALSTCVDLSRGPESIYAGMHTNCRYKVRRAEKMRDRIEIGMNTDSVRSDFFTLYNNFANSRGKIPSLKRQRFNEYLPHADVFMLYFDGQPTCGRLVLRDEESGTALMLYSGTRRLEKGADTITVGLLNRYLHWHEMKTYQAANLQKYDFGGVGGPNSSVTNFKMSFGGPVVESSYYVYAGSARRVWKLGHSLYNRTSLRKASSDNRTSETQSYMLGDALDPAPED
jgi:hypothetical protein